MQDQIIDFILKNPIVLILLVLLAPLVLVRRYRRMQRRMGAANDAKSKVMIALGLIIAVLVIAAILQNS